MKKQIPGSGELEATAEARTLSVIFKAFLAVNDNNVEQITLNQNSWKI